MCQQTNASAGGAGEMHTFIPSNSKFVQVSGKLYTSPSPGIEALLPQPQAGPLSMPFTPRAVQAVKACGNTQVSWLTLLTKPG